MLNLTFPNKVSRTLVMPEPAERGQNKKLEKVKKKKKKISYLSIVRSHPTAASQDPNHECLKLPLQEEQQLKLKVFDYHAAKEVPPLKEITIK